MNYPMACAAHQFDHLPAVDDRWGSSLRAFIRQNAESHMVALEP
jgi:hypothetical protein